MEQNGWGAAAPPMVPRPRTRSYASVADRFGGLLLDGLILFLAQIPIGIAFFCLSWIVGALAGTSTTCRQFDPSRFDSVSSQADACVQGAAVWFYGLIALHLAVNVWVWWRLIPGRMVRSGASVGMGIAGVEIEEADSESPIGAMRSLGRAVLAGLLPLACSGIPWLAAILLLGAELRRSDDAELSDAIDVASVGALALFVLALVAYVVPWCWAFWDRRNQTLYDKLAGTVVTGPPGPVEPWALASLATGLLAVVLWPFGPVAIVFGHLGIKAVRASRGEAQGRGAARAGQVLGWTATIVLPVIVLLTWSAADDTTHEARTAACRSEAVTLETVAAAFHQQQGRFPESDAEAVLAGLLRKESDLYELSTHDGSVRIRREDPTCPRWPE